MISRRRPPAFIPGIPCPQPKITPLRGNFAGDPGRVQDESKRVRLAKPMPQYCTVTEPSGGTSAPVPTIKSLVINSLTEGVPSSMATLGASPALPEIVTPLVVNPPEIVSPPTGGACLAQSVNANFGPEVLTGPGAALDDAGALGSAEAGALASEDALGEPYAADPLVLDDDDAHPTKLNAIVAAVADSMRRERVRDFIDTVANSTRQPIASRALASG